MLRKIKLYGKLAQFVGKRVLQAEVQNAAEAVRFLLANFPGLDQHMANQYYKVLVGADALTLDELHYPSGQQEIKIVPVIAGAGGNVGQIILGVALVAGAFLIPGLAAGAVLSGALSYGTAAAIANVAVFGGFLGASLVLNGVAGLLTPTPSQPKLGKDSDNDPSKSYFFNGVQNTSRQGLPVPVIFGEVITGSITISAGIDIDEE
jgi:predicted phage tail protein